MVKVTIELPVATTVQFEKGLGGCLKVDWAQVAKHPACLVAMLEGGANIILKNTYNSGGKDVGNAVKLAQAQKRLDGWHAGNYVTVERGESQFTAMREQYVDERKQAAGMSKADVDKHIRDTVTRVFGKDEVAHFGKFLDAVATEKHRLLPEDSQADTTPAMLRDAIETALADRTRKAAEARAKLASKLSTEGVVIDSGL